MSGAFAQNISEEFPLGPCKVTYNGNNLGHTDESTKLTIKATVVEAMAAKYGKATVGAYLNGQSAEVDCVLMQNDMTILAVAFPGATQVTNGAGASKITFGMTAGATITAYTLALVPEQGTNNPSSLNVNWTMQAVPVGDFEAVYDGGKIAGYKVKFKGIINEAGASNGSWLGQFGDSTITGVSTAPTVSAVNPANAATGVTQNNVTATISQALYAPDVTADSVLLIEDPTGTPTVYACNAPVLVNNGSSTTITLTAANGSNFTASKSYTFVINGTVRNQNLVPFAASFLSHFAT